MARTKVKDYATEYAKAVVSGKKEFACKAEIAVCKRHLEDLKRKDLEWKPDIAEKHIRFAEMLKVYDKNERKYKKLKLRGFQKFILCSIFGWYENGIRRYSEAYIQIARKNGKSFLNAFLCLDFSSLSAIRDGQIYCAGTNYDNASIVWKDCKKMLEGNPQLGEYFTIHDCGDSRSRIINNKNKTIIKPLSGSTDKDGFLPYLNCIDEYHLHSTDEMYNVLLDGQVSLNNSLTAAITTAGKNLNNNPCYEQYKYCKQVLAGTIEQDNLFIYIAETDLPDSHKQEKEYNEALWDRKHWAMANPLLLYDDDYHVTKDENKWRDFEDIAIKAKRTEGTVLNNFLIKKLNVWSTVGSETYVNVEDWAACGVDADAVNTKGKKCFVGLDLSTKNDLASISVFFPQQEGMNLPYVYSHSFLPKDTLQKHIMRDKFPYDKAAKHGYLSLTDCDGQNGYILDYKFIAKYLKEFIAANNLQVQAICYDAMGIGGIFSDLDEIVCDKIEIVQTPKSMNEATRRFQETVQGRQLQYDRKNELLSWSVCNAVSVLNSKQELLIDKRSTKNRIDAIDAALDAFKGFLLTYNDIPDVEKQKKQIDEWLTLMQEL